jgi:hypothetical protein
VKFLRADDQIDLGQLLQDRRPPALRHAAEKTDHLVLAAFFPALQRLHLPDRLLLGHVAHRAGVEQDDVGAIFALHQVIPRLARSRATCSESRTFIWQP